MIVDSNQEAKYNEMYSLLTDVFESTKGKLMFNDEKYRYALVLCKLTDSLNGYTESIYYAKKAIELSKIDKAQLAPKQVGVVKPKKADLVFLESTIAKEN